MVQIQLRYVYFLSLIQKIFMCHGTLEQQIRLPLYNKLTMHVKGTFQIFIFHHIKNLV